MGFIPFLLGSPRSKKVDPEKSHKENREKKPGKCFKTHLIR